MKATQKGCACAHPFLYTSVGAFRRDECVGREDTNLDRHQRLCLVAFVKKRLKSGASLYTILQILSLTLFEKTSLDQLLTGTEENYISLQNANQLNLFD